MSEPLIDLLRRRWQLSPQAEPVVEKLLKAWSQGHTALKLDAKEKAALKNSAAVSLGDDPRPLALSKAGLLQSWRMRQAERRVADKLRLLSQAATDTLAPTVKKALRSLFSDPTDAQAQVATLGLTLHFTLITGGPGTGKTFTAARLLALLALQDPARRFALAAPTGKAAQRLGQSVRDACVDLPKAVSAALPILQGAGQRASTLHKLLDWRPHDDRCGYNSQRPLPVDVVLVDEASMLDVFLWDSLLQALPARARLIVLGDQRQLESVEPGRVLGSLVDACDDNAGSLGASHVELTRNHRFAKVPAIAAAAAAIRDHDGNALLEAAPTAPSDSGVTRYAPSRLDAALTQVWPQITELATAISPQVALDALLRLRLLCALNEGPWGVSGLNQRVQAKLGRDGQTRTTQPLLIRANDAQAGLHNGDLGVLLDTPQGPQAYFAGPQGPRAFNPSSLPQYDLAWAMTVHRAQGSEYDSILLVLPPLNADGQAHELLRPELLYTALTRAKQRVILVADDEVLKAACVARERRVTGLAGWLLVA